MSDKKWTALFITLNLILINGVILAVLNLRYPLVGHDYTLALPSLLDTSLHFHLNGLSIQWFTPTFGGGIPAFPNPNNVQFSIPSLLAVFLPPWQVVMLSVVIYVSAGFLACYYFFNHTLKLNWTSSILGAFFFSANGFIITRVATGQLGYFSFTLLALFLIALLDEALSVRIASTILGLLIGIFIHFAGYFIIIIFGLSILMLFPILFIYKPELIQWKRIVSIIAIGGMIGIAISISKLTATFSFMRSFPRLIADNYSSSYFIGFLGIILELLGSMNLVPLFLVGGLNPDNFPNFTRGATGTSYGLWELDMSMTPVVFIILLIFLVNFIHDPQKYRDAFSSRKNKTALLIFIFFVWVGIEFTLAKGFVYPILRHLPILSSLRANVRFAAVFIFPLAFFTALIYNSWSKTWDRSKLFRTYLLVNILAVIPMGSYFLFNKDMFWMFYDIAGPQKIYEDIRAGKSFEVTEIGKPEGNNTGALLTRVSNLNMYEPVFGFKLENFHPQVQSGSIWIITDGYYNMTDPTGYVYPELNNNKPFDRFRIEDKQTLELFAKHIQPVWKIPMYQRILDWVSGLSFLASLLYLVVYGAKLNRNKFSA